MNFNETIDKKIKLKIIIKFWSRRLMCGIFMHISNTNNEWKYCVNFFNIFVIGIWSGYIYFCEPIKLMGINVSREYRVDKIEEKGKSYCTFLPGRPVVFILLLQECVLPKTFLLFFIFLLKKQKEWGPCNHPIFPLY